MYSLAGEHHMDLRNFETCDDLIILFDLVGEFQEAIISNGSCRSEVEVETRICTASHAYLTKKLFGDEIDRLESSTAGPDDNAGNYELRLIIFREQRQR